MWGRTPVQRAQKLSRREKEESNSDFKINDLPLAFFSKRKSFQVGLGRLGGSLL
jgi:hypothetical protein